MAVKRLLSAGIVIATIAFSLFVFTDESMAAQAETASLTRKIGPPPLAVKKESMYADIYYEPSTIQQGAMTGRWSEITSTFGYDRESLHGYLSVSQYTRFDKNDYATNVGSYLSFEDQYAHLEAGFGWDVDYIYRFQTTAEYAHRLYRGLYWQAGYAYREYAAADTHILYPGLVYYFGDHYLEADSGFGFIEGRDTAYFGSIKGDFQITSFLRIWSGVSFGERLYDIYGLDASEERGYMVFGGVTIKPCPDVSARVGCSYSTEKPKFIRRGISIDLSIKF